MRVHEVVCSRRGLERSALTGKAVSVGPHPEHRARGAEADRHSLPHGGVAGKGTGTLVAAPRSAVSKLSFLHPARAGGHGVVVSVACSPLGDKVAGIRSRCHRITFVRVGARHPTQFSMPVPHETM